ncbi:hypothetical protein QBC40DRAFT_347897 [Triangularia verruculosa]|uniref:Heterokaryon incompatibility domain-containing protein n=1 Tax=Triangularia verruculosa TaxID=2587418 RepID=A0AAN6XJC0_9PEZI|nr:hypothetical protein QBC40DRAFT_347897 [Triangularia verruculosa]
MMGHIYRRCLQVVVYLGPDIAPLLPPGRYPRRMNLESIADCDLDGQPVFRHDTASLFRKRYFSRLWVVQELVLASRVVIRVGDIDFWADRASTLEDRKTLEGADWPSKLKNHDKALWMTHIASAGLSTRDLDIGELLQLTRHAQCADPRDRIFGLTGILTNLDFRANYTLSCQHVYIGLFADLMIRGQRYGLLECGPGTSDSSLSLPSWVPDWKDWSQWNIVLESEYFDQDHACHYRAGSFHNLVSYLLGRFWSAPKPTHMATILLEPHMTLESQMVRRLSATWSDDSESSQDRTLACDYQCPKDDYVNFALDRSNGNLHANMTRLCTLQTRPNLIQSYQDEFAGRQYFLFEFTAGRLILWFTSRHRLDQLVLPGKDTLYLTAFKTNHKWPQVLLLRQAGDATNVHRLIASCGGILFGSEDGFEEPGRSGDQDVSPDWNWFTGHHGLKFVHRLSFSLQNLYDMTKAWLHSELQIIEEILNPLAKYHKDMIPVYQALMSSYGTDGRASGSTERTEPSLRNASTVISAYARCFNTDSGYSQSLPYSDSEGHIYLTVPTSLASKLLDHQPLIAYDWVQYAPTNGLERPDRRLFEGTESRCLCTLNHLREEDGSWRCEFIVLRLRNYDIFDTLSQTYGFWLIGMIRLAEKRGGKMQDELLLDWCNGNSALTDEEKQILVPAGETSRMLMDGFGITGNIEKVIIA